MLKYIMLLSATINYVSSSYPASNVLFVVHYSKEENHGHVGSKMKDVCFTELSNKRCFCECTGCVDQQCDKHFV